MKEKDQKNNLEFRNKIIMSAINIFKMFFEVYDTDSSEEEVKQLKFYYVH